MADLLSAARSARDVEPDRIPPDGVLTDGVLADGAPWGDLVVLVGGGVDDRAAGEGVVATGTGAEAVADAVARLRSRVPSGMPVAVVGPAERLRPELRPGQLVVANEIWTVGEPSQFEPSQFEPSQFEPAQFEASQFEASPAGPVSGGPSDGAQVRSAAPAIDVPTAELVAAELRRAGHDVTVGPVVTVRGEPGTLDGAARTVLAKAGALVCDHDSAWAAALAGDGRALAVVRVVGDRPPVAPVAPAVDSRLPAAWLAAVRPPLERWARACGRRRVVLASPRSFCAGVERAIEIVERALDRYGAPVYVRRQIVHNQHVVARLAARGAVFVEELDDVPDAATVVLAAHGVSPAVRRQAAERGDLHVIDATCPLVAKVHHEARRYDARGYEIVLIGHPDHEEVVGTVGEAPGRTHLVTSVDDVDRLEIGTDRRIAYLTQTTLATDETADVVDALRRRFPDVVGPSADDICYATQNRQDAVRAIAGLCDLVLVVGSANSSNTARLVEVARREGCRAELVEDAGQLRLSWLDGAETVGLTAGASAPDSLVEELVRALGRLGPIEIDEHRTASETVHFALPPQVR